MEVAACGYRVTMGGTYFGVRYFHTLEYLPSFPLGHECLAYTRTYPIGGISVPHTPWHISGMILASSSRSIPQWEDRGYPSLS